MRKFVVTGCGRSGTGSLAQSLTAAGIPCGHEDVFTVYGQADWGDLRGDASWFAAGMPIPADVGVIHLVRDPLAVAASFYRIGLFATMPWRTVLMGGRSLRRLVGLACRPVGSRARIRYVRAQRQLVRRNTTVFTEPDEARRCLRYWEEWNNLAAALNDGQRRYLCIRLEDDPWHGLRSFLGVELRPVRDNRKSSYPPRPFPDVAIPPSVAACASRYGYDTTT